MVTKPAFILSLFLGFLLAGCAADASQQAGSLPETPVEAASTASPAQACEVTTPEWVKPDSDAAVLTDPEFGNYYINEDRSIWASAWWTESEDYALRASEESIKVGWFRPDGAELEITGKRIDAPAPPLEANVPCCYPTRFQATGLLFPTEGCWEVNAKAAGKELTFVVYVEP